MEELSAQDRMMTPKVRGERVFVPLDPAVRATLEAWQPSPAGDRFAYQISHDGTEDSLLFVLDDLTETDAVRITKCRWSS